MFSSKRKTRLVPKTKGQQIRREISKDIGQLLKPMKSLDFKNSKPRSAFKQARDNRQSFVPNATTRTRITPMPLMNSSNNSSSDGRMRIRHREYISDVSGIYSFGALTNYINPGNASLFPWLSVIAANFESYLFKKLDFLYDTECSTQTAGAIMLAVDYDALDSTPLSKTQMMAYHGAVRSAVWAECKNICDTRDLRKFGIQRYIRLGAVPTGADQKTYDVGLLIQASQGIGTSGSTTQITTGELYVEYDVELITPQLSAIGVGSNSVVGGGTIANSAIFGTAPVVKGLGSVSALGSTITFGQPGQYLIEFNVTGTVLAIPSVGTLLNATASAVGSVINTAATNEIATYLVTSTAVGATVQIVWTASTTVTAATLRSATYAAANG